VNVSSHNILQLASLSAFLCLSLFVPFQLINSCCCHSGVLARLAARSVYFGRNSVVLGSQTTKLCILNQCSS